MNVIQRKAVSEKRIKLLNLIDLKHFLMHARTLIHLKNFGCYFPSQKGNVI